MALGALLLQRVERPLPKMPTKRKTRMKPKKKNTEQIVVANH
jgi:hypothetical protein